MLNWTYTTITCMSEHIERWDACIPHLYRIRVELYTGTPGYRFNDTYVLRCVDLNWSAPLSAKTLPAAQRQAVEYVQKELKAALAALETV